jgi:hypothetical protein
MPYAARKFSMLSRQPENEDFDDYGSLNEGINSGELKKLVAKQQGKRDKLEDVYE